VVVADPIKTASNTFEIEYADVDPAVSARGAHRVVALAHPPQSLFGLSLAAEVFNLSRPDDVDKWYEFFTCAFEPGLVAVDAGYEINVAHDLSIMETADTIVIPGWNARQHRAPGPIVDGLRAAHANGARIIAICAGGFLLAETGLLSGRRATTHWLYAAELAQRYPDINVDPSVLYIDHGDVATSAGMAAGIDLCLQVVRTDYGAAYAADVARRMVMPPHREGGQAQFIRPSWVRRDTSPLGPVLDWAVNNLAQPLTVARLARRAGMSTRTFVRRFQEEVGVSPGQWVLSQRVGAAQQLLEHSTLSVETIAQRVGFASALNLRRCFHRRVGVTPAVYRRTFR
jgi:AraC family transcriptional activator FtrA